MFTLPLLTSGLEAGGRPVSEADALSWNQKRHVLEFSTNLRSYCFLPPLPAPRSQPGGLLVVGGGKVTGEGRSLIMSNIYALNFG